MKKKFLFLCILSGLIFAGQFSFDPKTPQNKELILSLDNFGFAEGSGFTPEEAFACALLKIPNGAFIYSLHTKVYRSEATPEVSSGEIRSNYLDRIPTVNSGALKSLSLLNGSRDKNWIFEIKWAHQS